MTAVPAVIVIQEISYVNCSPTVKGRAEERVPLSPAHDIVTFMTAKSRYIRTHRRFIGNILGHGGISSRFRKLSVILLRETLGL
jgi:hypothetical protein